MRAIEIPAPGEIRLIEKEMPKPAAGEALLRVLCCGICGADVASYTGNQPFTTYPRIPGHEFSAQLVSVPENDAGWKTGDLVTANPYFNCGDCYVCRRGLVNACVHNQTMGVQRDGSFQEYITMPLSRLISGKGLSPEALALIEPFAISRHAVSHAEIAPGKTVLIMGAGPIGLFALLAAKAQGARVAICDKLENRLALAAQFGADCTLPAEKDAFCAGCRQFTNGDGFDVCIEACGVPETFLSCLREAAHGADVVLIGNGKRETTFLHSVLLQKELRVFGSRNARTADFEALIRLVCENRVDPMRMVSGIFTAETAAEAFSALAKGNGAYAKLLVRFSEMR